MAYYHDRQQIQTQTGAEARGTGDNHEQSLCALAYTEAGRRIAGSEAVRVLGDGTPFTCATSRKADGLHPGVKTS